MLPPAIWQVALQKTWQLWTVESDHSSAVLVLHLQFPRSCATRTTPTRACAPPCCRSPPTASRGTRTSSSGWATRRTRTRRRRKRKWRERRRRGSKQGGTEGTEGEGNGKSWPKKSFRFFTIGFWLRHVTLRKVDEERRIKGVMYTYCM